VQTQWRDSEHVGAKLRRLARALECVISTTGAPAHTLKDPRVTLHKRVPVRLFEETLA
jgi:hypothetical protein